MFLTGRKAIPRETAVPISSAGGFSNRVASGPSPGSPARRAAAATSPASGPASGIRRLAVLGRERIPCESVLSPIPAQAAAMLVLGRKEIPARWFLPHPARRTRANGRASGWASGVAAET
jgi:hypothetical protein